MPTHHILYGLAWSSHAMFAEPLPDALKRLVASGLRVVEADTTFWSDESFRKTLVQHGLIPVVRCAVATPNELAPALQLARDAGALLVTVQVVHALSDSSTAIALISAMCDMAAGAGVRIVFEAPCPSPAQDLALTADLAHALPRLGWNLCIPEHFDVSVPSGPWAHLKPWLDPILSRIQMIRGVMPGTAPRPETPDQSSPPCAPFPVATWAEAMRRWRRTAPPGSAFVFTADTRPPGEAGAGSDQQATADCWRRVTDIRALGEEAWKCSAKPASVSA
jgi:hypothetical protein